MPPDPCFQESLSGRADDGVMSLRSLVRLLQALLVLGLPTWHTAHAATPAELVETYRQQAGVTADPSRGRTFFTRSHGREWSCASCHGAVPLQQGRHATTGKDIQPLAPAANPRRLTDPVKVEKWLGRNCQDVLGRPCTPGEKADVLAYLAGLER